MIPEQDKERPRISVVIPSFNTRSLTDNCLRSLALAKGAFDLDVILVDNASSDGTVELIAERHPSVRVVRNEENRYFAAAANQGAYAGGGDWILFLNSDVEVEPDTIAKMLERQGDGIASIVPVLLGIDGRVQHEYTFRRFPRPWDLVLNLLFFRRWSRLLGISWRWNNPTAAADRDRDVEQPGASCLLMRADIFRDLGGFDESLPLWFNDVDLCRRIAGAGLRNRFANDARVGHVGGASTISLSDTEQAKRLYLDSLQYVRKWHPRAVGMIKLAVLINYSVRTLLKLLRPRELSGWVRATPDLLSALRFRAAASE